MDKWFLLLTFKFIEIIDFIFVPIIFLLVCIVYYVECLLLFLKNNFIYVFAVIRLKVSLSFGCY